MSPTRAASSRGTKRASSSGAITAADREIAALAKALAHPARVAIVRTLTESGECVCGSLVDRLPLAQATVSQHLKVLKDAGLIRGEIDRPRVCYCANPQALVRLRTLLAGLGSGPVEEPR
jgi:ArsR family transcriptional regulator, arsenate/arsenite/antimonite-responsive transcriptional repressor